MLSILGPLPPASPAHSAAAADIRAAETHSPQHVSPAVLPGIDVWRQRHFEPLTGRRIGLITNPTGRDAAARLTVEVLRSTDALTLAALFSPEHGFTGVEEGSVASGTDAATGLPVFSLYGDRRRPTDEMLEGLEGLVFDIQDIGTRFYTYATTMAFAMEAAAARGLPFVVLDRPNPITGTHVEGPILDDRLLSFVGYAPLPLRHGMTIGELARYFNQERGIGADLTVVPVKGWRREQWYDDTGLLWINPSPNMRNLTEAILYPAVAPLESTNVSVGRGTDEPFEWLGAPWIDAFALAGRLNDAGLPGIRFLPRRRTPESNIYAGQVCNGVDLMITDREAFRAATTAITLASSLYSLAGEKWQAERFARLWGRPEVVEQLRAGMSPAAIAASWKEQLATFRSIRQRYLLYD
ncbi:MAG: exo-beta-N-acetylmuramidase NamZ domain-containing protein [Acidobacteriota bacterium]